MKIVNRKIGRLGPLWLILCVAITFTNINTLRAQLINNNNWYFGNSSQALIFTKADTFATIEENIQFTPFGQGGSAVISNEVDGNLIFYTDGFSVYDATHAVVPNGTNLNGDPSINQPAIAVPISMASNSNWYIFTNDGNDIFSTRVDFLNAPGNATAPTQPDLGDVFVADKNVATGLSNSSPAMAIFKNTTAIPAFEFWLLSHDRVTGDLRVTEVSGAGAAIGATTNVSPTAQLLVAENFSSIVVGDTARIAISPQNANANVQIWKLSLTDGVLEFDRGILNTGNADDVSPAIYDTEWSSDGSKLYISRHGSTGLTGNLYQFDFNDTLQNVNSVLPSPVFRSFGVKLGPNDTLYHLFQPTAASPIELGALSRPSDVIDSVSYDLQPFTNDNFNGRQFPEFAPPSGRFALVNFSFDGNCMNSPIRFTPEVEPSAISYFWDFNGEGTSNSHSPVFTFSTAGAKNVELTVMLEDAMETFTRSVMITDPQLMIMLPNDTTLCRGESLPLNPMPSATPLSTIWNTGETDPIINVDSVGLVDPGGTYWVSMQGPGGCSVYDEIVITIYEDTVTSSNQWYFGDMAGIDFNTNTAVTDGVSQSPEAAATFSDANGDLLMYTNGVTIYNKEHQRMVNGDNLGGDSTSAQGALIVQLPMDETIYYVFMTDPAWEDRTFDLRYAVVDLKLDSSRGAVVLKDRLLYSKSTERLAATGFGTGGNVWLISHEFGNNTFRTYPIDTAGIGQPVYSTVGTILSPAIEGHSRNYLKLVNGTQLVMTISDPDVPGDNFVELYDFDPTTGKVSNPRKINIGEPAPAEVYGVEIAGDRLWVTTRGGGGSKLIQFDIDTTNVAVIEASKFDQYAVNEELGAIETGPNGTVFIATNGLASLATIGSPTSDDGDATYNANGFDLAGRNSTFGLPNFTRPSANAGQTPQLIVGPGCRGQDIALSVTGLSQIDFIDWIFGDGQGIDSTQVSDTTHVYNVAGNYTVQARIFNRCGLNMTLSQMITIGDDIPRPTVPGVTALCDDTLILDAYANNPGLVLPTFAYTWSTGDTTQTITVNAPSTLSVFVTDRVTGCISDTVQVLVGDGRPQVDLGPPRTICQNEALGPFDAGNPGASYAWTIDGTASGSGRFQNVNTSVAGIFNYEVAVTDPITGCIGRSNLVLTINEEPQLAVSNIVAPLNCGDANATFSLDFSSSGSFSYDVISGGAGSVSIASGSITGPGSIPVAGLSAGNYSITATNDVTGCSNTISTNISDFNTGYSATLTPLPGCSTTGNASDLSDLTLDLVDNGGLPTSFNYELIDNAGMTVQSGSSTSASLPLTLSDLDSGVYNVVVTRTAPGLACVETAQVTLNELPAANIIVDPIYNFCGGQGTIPATTVPGATLTWTLPDGSTAVVNSLVTTQSGTHTVRSTGPNLCDRVETVEVIISNDPVVTIDVVGDLCDGMLTLIASGDDPTVASSFVWGSSDANNGAVGSTITVMQSGTYTVTTRNQSTGCLSNTAVDVLVEPVLELFIESEPDCDNNPNVFLNAVSNITADVTFEWINPSGIILPDTTATISVTESGNYSARVIRVNSGCDATAFFNITIEPIADEDLVLPVRGVICSLEPSTANITLDAGAFNSYEWRLLPDETVISTAQQLTVNTEGRYEVTIFNGFTCTRDVIDVVEDCTPRIFAPNAFTPNGDGINDNFFVFSNPFVTDFKIWIHNRWGELIFQADNIDFRWDGDFLNEEGQVGTYAYVVRFRSTVEPELGELEQHGAVTLIR